MPDRPTPLEHVAHSDTPLWCGAPWSPRPSTCSATSREGVPPLSLTGERTLPDVPEENYWYRRHLVVYEWIAARAHGRRVVDLACGEGYGTRGAGAHRAVGGRRRREPRGLRARAPEVHGGRGALRAQHARAVGRRRGLRRVPADDRARPGPRRGAGAHPRADRARAGWRTSRRRTCSRSRRRAPSARATRGTCASTGPRSSAPCASATSARSTSSASSTRASCACTSSRSSARGGTRSTARCGITKPFYDRFTPAISVRDFRLRRDGLERALDLLAVLRP